MSQSSASIEDLLQYEEEPATRTGRRSGLGRLVREASAAAALTAVTIVGLRLFGVALPVVAVLAGWVALLALRRVTGRLAPPPPGRRRAYRHVDESDSPNADDLRNAVHRWERPLMVADRDGERFRQVIISAVGELIDERLRQRRGYTRATDPDRARALLGEQVWALLTNPPRRSPAPGDYATLIATVEKI